MIAGVETDVAGGGNLMDQMMQTLDEIEKAVKVQ